MADRVLLADEIPLSSRLLASGEGWHVRDVICRARAGDRRFEEQHGVVCIAAVTSGTFQYRTQFGEATLVPGALMLGNAGCCYECSHDHGAGDHCISLGLSPALLQDVARATPGVRRMEFDRSRVAPDAWLVPYIAELESLRTSANDDAAEEIVLTLAGDLMKRLQERPAQEILPTRLELARVSDAVRYIEARCEEPLTLSVFADQAHMSRYHFLRVFRRVTGTTPHQFLMRTRLRQAALKLRQTTESVTAIAFGTGFGDLSAFNRSFRRAFGCAPNAFRSRS